MGYGTIANITQLYPCLCVSPEPIAVAWQELYFQTNST